MSSSGDMAGIDDLVLKGTMPKGPKTVRVGFWAYS